MYIINKSGGLIYNKVSFVCSSKTSVIKPLPQFIVEVNDIFGGCTDILMGEWQEFSPMSSLSTNDTLRLASIWYMHNSELQ